MILALDIGNTNIVIGCIDKEKTCFIERLSTVRTKTELEYAVDIKTVLDIYGMKGTDIEGCIISSVVPQITNAVRLATEKVVGKDSKIFVLGPGIKTGLDIKMDNPGQLGADLVAAAVAGIAQYPAPMIIVDMGTATTATVINSDKQFIGGMIMPGVGISLDALTSGASLLSSIAIEAPKRVIGKNTIDCMKSGVLYSNAGAIDGIRNRWQELRYITLPSMSHMLLFSAVMSIQGSFSVSGIATELAGYPSKSNAVDTIVSLMQDMATVRYELGYASAIAVVLFIMMVTTRLFVGKVLSSVQK